MTLPAVNITELDGQLSVLPPSEGKLFACVGVSSTGPANTPATFARVKDVVASYGAGPLVEAACHYIQRYGRPVVVVRTGQSVAGSPGTLASTVAGTSVPTLDTTAPNDDYEGVLTVLTGGTLGVAGITIKWSLDGGRTFSPATALGTALTFVFPGSGGVNIDFGAGTLVAGDTMSFRTVAPCWNGTELGLALDALGASSVNWEIAHIVGPLDSTTFDTVDLKITGMASASKNRAWIGSTRVPTLVETEAEYLTSLSAAFASDVSTYGMLCAGACKLSSSVSGRKYKRPAAFAIAARSAFVSPEVNIADLKLGTLQGVDIVDSNGNPQEHNEATHPGLDDSRFTVLRTWEGYPGVYINRPRLFSAPGSDFQLLPHRRVLNIAHEALRQYFILRLASPIQINKATGFITEAAALELERGAFLTMQSALLAKPFASAVQFVLSRTDNLLSTKTLNGQARVIPLGYAEFINLDLGFAAVQLSSAA